MNCLVITELLWPEGSGAELATYLYAKLLSQKGIDVTVLTGSLNRTSWVGDGFKIIPWVPSIKPQTKYSSLLLASSLLRKPYNTLIEKADVVYISKCCWAIPPVKNLTKPVVISAHEYSPICPTATFYNYASKSVCNGPSLFSCMNCVFLHENTTQRGLVARFLSQLLNITLGQFYGMSLLRADAIIFVSHFQRDTIVKHIPEISGKSHVIYNPIPTFEEGEVESRDYGFFGGTNSLKGFQVLLEGLRNINKVVKVHLAGRTDERFRITSPLLTYHGWLDSQNVHNLLRRTIATIFPSIMPEPCPYVVVEGMLLGKIIIASAIGGVPEITKGAPGVFLFPPGDAISIAKKIEQVESMDSDSILKLGKGNRDLARLRFRNKQIMDKFIGILNKVVQ